ncbi:MAG TPA: TonB-dependent receptor [Puia sp.]|nr:TonB-dependent receptor [Puia sp.]
MQRSTKQFSLWVFVSLFTFCFGFGAAAQQQAQHITVRGVIKNDSGQAISQATVLIKGGTSGVHSNDQGEFEITADPNAVLVISSVSYITTEIPVKGRSSLTVVLSKSNTSLDQVVVVGYGTQRKRDVTGSIVSVSAKTLNEVPAVNVGVGLQGRAAGLEVQKVGTTPGATPVIRIRGERSILGSNDPLLVLDGIPYEGGTLNDINPQDIASIEILKDASATAIYGSRGSNGVLLISTKKGKSGPATINFSNYVGVNSVTKKYPVFNAQEYTAMRAAANAATNAGYLNDAFETANLAKGVNTDWQGLMYEKGLSTDDNITVSGGSPDGSSYSLGGGYHKETAVLPGQDFERYSLRATIDTKIGKHAKVGINSMNTYSDANGTQFLNGGTMFSIVAASPLYTPDSGGIVVLSPFGNTTDKTSNYNPVLLKHNNSNWVDLVKRFRSFNTLYAEYQFPLGIKYRVNVGLSYQREEDDQFKGADTKGDPSFFRPSQGSTASVNNKEEYGYTLENILTYDKEFRGGHHLNFTGLYSIEQDISHNTSVSKDSINADFIEYYDLGLSNPSNNVKAVLGGAEATWGLESYMGRVNYSFLNKYLLTATYRIDGSSRLAAGHKYHEYPALSAGWHISDEKFMERATFLNDLKLRVGYGETSNQAINPYASLGNVTPYNGLTTAGAIGSTTTYNYGPATVVTGYNLQSLPNSNLDWEYTRTTNIGLDYAVLKSRIIGSVDYYDAHTRNILFGITLPITSGVTGQYVSNIGEMSNKGFEFSLTTINVIARSGFSWTTDLNVFWNRNKLLKLYNGFTENIADQLFIGQPISAIYDYKKVGIWQTADAAKAASYGAQPGYIKFADLNNDGKIDPTDREVIGSAQAKWQGGITNRFAYKGFDLSFVIYTRMGGTLVSQVYQPYGDYLSILNGIRNNVKVDYWTPTNPTNKFPSPAGMLSSNVIGLTTLGYYDASFIKMRSINLGYSFSNRVIGSIKAQYIRVYVTAENPFVLYSPYMKEGGVDPEATALGNTGVQNPGNISTRALTIGLATPPTRAFLFGVNVGF